MNDQAKCGTPHPPRDAENSLARPEDAVVAFREYTKRIWSRAAARPISDEQADQIISDFGRFLEALDKKDGEE